ncbi:alpha-amylase family glycosyl hydrolase [Deltaproteobacteria bacterium TL4]
MWDVVVNHTSDEHEWALKAKQGNAPFGERLTIWP